MNPIISIITVSYNEVNTIEKTIRSIINQSYQNIEYIIIDGKSDDGTLELIKKYKDKISSWVSEKDNGLYDAMNKGMEMASGDYLLLINAGDELYAPSTISEFVIAANPKIDIIYGKAQLFHVNNTILKPTENNHSTLPCHNAIFFSKKVYKNNRHNTDYVISADSIFIQQAIYKYSTQFLKDLIVCKFELGGVSNYYSSYKQFSQHLADRKKMQMLIKQTKLNYLLGNILLFFKFLLSSLLGKEEYLKLYFRILKSKNI